VHVLATAQIPASARRLLEGIGSLSVSGGALAEELGGVEVLVVRAEPIDAVAIELATRLRVIARTGSGVDNVDVEAATARRIPVLNVPSAGTGPVAEGTWALILAAAKRLGELHACIAEDRWEERYAIEGLDLRESTLGIVGLGSIGREVARVGDAFGMRVIGFDARLPEGVELEVPVRRTDLDTLIRQADVVTLHCDLNESTRGLVDRDLLRRAERHPILVNAARGGVIDGDELLLEALEQGWLSAVGLDVFACEPLSPDSPLLSDPRIVCTPHSIGLTRRWNERVFKSLVRDIERVLEGRPPKHIVNPEVLDGAVPG
jgi:D-3-phosphoglycerate dehydrogenase / 2-oxoglutarate reductase